MSKSLIMRNSCECVLVNESPKVEIIFLSMLPIQEDSLRKIFLFYISFASLPAIPVSGLNNSEQGWRKSNRSFKCSYR